MELGITNIDIRNTAANSFIELPVFKDSKDRSIDKNILTNPSHVYLEVEFYYRRGNKYFFRNRQGMKVLTFETNGYKPDIKRGLFYEIKLE